MALLMVDLGWIAGFLEGEGSFGLSGRNRQSPRVRAPQLQREPLDRLQRLLGGKIALQPPTSGTQPVHHWALDTNRSVQLMMTLYTLMSPRRQQQIAKALAAWRTNPRFKSAIRTRCPNGHRLSPDNVYVSLRPNGKRRLTCRKCERVRETQRQRRNPYRNRAKTRACSETLQLGL
jgi:hypothetical protein